MVDLEYYRLIVMFLLCCAITLTGFAVAGLMVWRLVHG